MTNMISLTAAVKNYRARSIGGMHLKAFGSGRVALGSVEDDLESFERNRYFTHRQPVQQRSPSRLMTSMQKTVSKFVHVLLNFVNSFCPLLSLLVYLQRCADTEAVQKKRRIKREVPNSSFDRLEDKLLLEIFKFCDAQSVLNLEMSCSRLCFLIHKHCNELPKVQKDQIKLHFDEGEVIVFPMDERRVPARFPMPSIEHLGRYLRHISTLSLFIRGLIPMESIPVLKRLSRYSLSAHQIYFLWCDFDTCVDDPLKNLFASNVGTLSDIGFEVCSPTNIVSDDLIEQNLPELVSLRVWHQNSNKFGISDQTLFRCADLFKSSAGCPLETLDVSGGNFTVGALCELIHAWYSHPKNDLYLSLHQCNFTQTDIVNGIRGDVPFSFNRGLRKGRYQLILKIA